ncbi:MAG: APC family permease [Gammaproteobacteria bacterium]
MNLKRTSPGKPQPADGLLTARAAASVAVGMVVGAGLFKSPALVAANVGSDAALFGAWLLGGVLALLGATCYAELAAAFPSQGGDYRFLTLAYGRRVGFLFAWARFAVINTGSLALLSFVLGDYLQATLPLGSFGSSIYATITLLVLSVVNLRSRSAGIDTQVGLTLTLVAGMLLIGLVGLLFVVRGTPPLDPTPATGHSLPSFGLAMVFVMLAYGGWTEIATLSAEMRDPAHGMLRALMLGLGAVTALYLVINWALWRGLGLSGLASSPAPASRLMALAFARGAELPVIAVVFAAVVTSINATIIVGARTTFAAARDWPALGALADWNDSRGIPAAALVAQSLVALVLIGLGTATREGFATLVDYTAPVYWLFMALSGIALIILRRRQPLAYRPFRAPLYPVLPLVFTASSLFVLWSSVAYVRVGAIAGLAVLALGLLAAAWLERRAPAASA